MSELQDRINKRMRAEAPYLRGYQCINLERFRHYRDEFQTAHERSDFRKMHEVVQATVTISNDTIRLIRKRMAITARRSFTFASDTASPTDDIQSPLPRLRN